ncbi:MAG TPA: hypothetical protein VMV43_10400 [Candidatus Nanopelagicaceae bacterium]|nr:hypothetical protein [Candidatus Nanopelagicaceae bacterium]
MPESEEKILSLLKKIDEKLDKLLGAKEFETDSRPSTAQKKEEYVKPSAVVEKQEEEEKAKIKPPVEGRRVCPACGGIAFNTEEDKSQILFQQGGMKIFAKRYICKQCGTEA